MSIVLLKKIRNIYVVYIRTGKNLDKGCLRTENIKWRKVGTLLWMS